MDSLLGKNSDAAGQFAEWLIQHNYAHTLATDAHNIRRKPNLSTGFDIVDRLMGSDRVKEMKDRASSILPKSSKSPMEGIPRLGYTTHRA